METLIQALVWIVFGIAVIIIIAATTGGRSISRFFLAKDILEMVRKTMPGAIVADAKASVHGDIEVELVGRQGKMKVYRRSGLLIGVFAEESAPIPKTGKFRFIARVIQDDPRLDASAVDQRLKAAFTTSIAAKGYLPADSMDADVLVTIHLALEGSVDEAQIGDTYGYHIPELIDDQSDADSEQPSLPERASLIIDFVDPKGRILIWRVSLLTDIVVEVSDEERTRRTNDAIAEMLTFFPPKSLI